MLVMAARDGSRAAQEALFRRHVRRCVGLAHRLLSASQGEVDDLVQDSFIVAFNNLNGLRDPQAFASWLTSIVVRTAGKRLRHQRLLQRLGLRRHEPIDLETITHPSVSSEKILELRELYSQLSKFPAEEAIVLVLKRVEGLDMQEIADQLGVSMSTAKRRLRRAEERIERFQRRVEQ